MTSAAAAPEFAGSGSSGGLPPRGSTLRHLGAIFGTQSSAGAILFVNSFLIARLLGPADKGMTALLVLIPTVLLVLFNAGFRLSAARLASRSEQVPARVLETVFVFVALVSLFVAILAAVFWLPLTRVVYRGAPSATVVVSLLSLPGILLIYICEGLWIALGRMRIVAVVRLGQALVYLVSGIVAIAVFHLGVFGGILGFCLGSFAAAAAIGVEAWRLGARPGRFPAMLLRAGLRFGLTTHPGGMAEYALDRSDSLLVGYLLPLRELGYYSIAVPVAELVWYVSYGMRALLFARTSGSAGDDADRFTPLAVRGTVFLAALLAAAAFAVATIAIHLVLPSFVPAIPAMGILLVATVIGVIFHLITADLSARGFGGRSSQISLTALPIGIGAYLLLISRLGIVGAALGSLIAYSTEAALSLYWFRRLTGISPRDLLSPRRSDLAYAVRLVRDLRKRSARNPGE